MKKILSIGNLFVKRIGLVAILLATIGVGDVWAAAETTLKVTKSPTSGAGNATVATSETGTYAATQSQSSGNRLTTQATHTYWLKAETTSTAWLWKGWYSDGALKLAALSGSTTVKDNKLIGSVTKTYTATWVQPKVTGTTAGENGGTNIKLYTFGEYTDPTIGSETKSIVFTLENNDAGLIAKDGSQPENYYTEALTGSWTATTFVKESHTYAKGNQNYTYNVSYKLSGVHATNITANIKLTSKYGGSNYTAKLNAIENYTPYFNYAYTEYNYTPDDPLAEGESLAQTFNVSKNCYAANNGVWSISLPADAAAKGFTLQTAADNPNATVQFEALPGINKADLTTTLTAVCTYTDARGTKVTYTQTILLSGDAGKVITIDGAEVNTMTFDIDYAASGESTQTLPFMTTLTGPTTTSSNLPAGDFITYTTWTTGLTEVAATVKHNLTPGQYTPSIKYSYNSDEVYSILNIVANIRLAQPVITATVGQGQQITLSWQSVHGATSYIIEGKGTADANFIQLNIIGDDEPIETSYIVNNIGGVILTTGTEYAFRVTAVYGPDEFANRLSNEVTATPSAQGSITASSTVKLYTGTEIFVEGNTTYGVFPYRKKRAINLDAAFSPSGAPLFDKLYIFGMTTSEVIATVSGQTGHKITPASNTKGSDAITPCYVYVKNGNQYDLQQTIPNMNVANKPIADISGATSVYLTGYCPYASTGGGNNKDENGVIAFTGGAGVNTHVYVDDLQLFARYKSNNGNTSKPDTVRLSGLKSEYYCSGTSTAFSFEGTSTNSSNPFKPTIHMRDSNRLTGSTGSAIKVEISFLGMSMTQVAGQYNSPIGILNDNDGKEYTTLSIDDVWPASMVDNAASEVRTNGYLDIRGGSGAPSIDLYDDKGKVNFNGGRYYLKNSRPTGSNNYLCTFAVGYRKYVKEVSGIKATMFGLGTDQSGGEVNFNDGSFYVDTLTNDEWTKHGKYYHHKYALKCPASSTINGGTFYCEPFASTDSENKGASPLNRYGDGLVLDTVAVESLLEPYHTAVINFPNDKEVQAEYAATYPATLGEYYTAKGTTYGISSLNAYQGIQAPDSVILMLPVQYTDKELQQEVVNVPWAMCVPSVKAGGTITLGGDVEVIDEEENNTIYQTNYLLYGAIDEYIVGIEDNYKTPAYDGLPNAEVSFNRDGDKVVMSSEITNENEYTIQQEQYMLMSVKGDEWMLFSPPFDISEVYVIETYKEDALAAMAKSTSWHDAIEMQAAANMDFFYALCYNIGYLKTPNGLDAIYYDWSVTLAKNNNAKGKIKLNHFTGSNYTANYYLQRSSGQWTWDAEKERFVTDWKYLPATMEKVTHGETEYSVVMKKGEIYSLNFPYMYNGYREKGDGNGNNNWDYWTGKYILFVGKGPQTIEGINYHDNIDADMKAAPGYAEVRVNPTFAAIEIADMGAYFLGDNQQFNCNLDNDWGEILPTSGFVLANTNTPSPMPQRIKSIDMQTGEVTTEPGVSTSTPTIGGNKHMMVYNIEGGVGIVPVVEQQVSIYNAAGQLVTSEYLTDEVQISLPSGIYLISGTKDQFKAVVK